MPSRLHNIDLVARVRRRVARPCVGQPEACDLLDASDRTLRDWAARGMPVEHGQGETPRYCSPDVLAWSAYYGWLCKSGRAPGHLPIEAAVDWVLRREAEDDWSWYITVPLEWDHPRREGQLRLAAEGREPPPE